MDPKLTSTSFLSYSLYTTINFQYIITFIITKCQNTNTKRNDITVAHAAPKTPILGIKTKFRIILIIALKNVIYIITFVFFS